MSLFQKTYWEQKKGRRDVEHPAVVACAEQVLSLVREHVCPEYDNQTQKANF